MNRRIRTRQISSKPKPEPTTDREVARMLSLELGVPEASKRTGIPEGTLYSWSSRYTWGLPKRAGRPARELQVKGGDVLINSHVELATRTKTALARATAAAAEQAAKQSPVPVTNVAQMRDLAATAARIFGWDAEKQGDTYNTMVISREDLHKIRAIRALMNARDEQSPAEAPQSSPAAVPWPSGTNSNEQTLSINDVTAELQALNRST